MSFLPILTFRELSRLLRKIGYFPVRQKGSHVIFENARKETLTVPHHRGRTIGKGLLRSLINDMNLDVDDFMKLYHGK